MHAPCVKSVQIVYITIRWWSKCNGKEKSWKSKKNYSNAQLTHFFAVIHSAARANQHQSFNKQTLLHITYSEAPPSQTSWVLFLHISCRGFFLRYTHWQQTMCCYCALVVDRDLREASNRRGCVAAAAIHLKYEMAQMIRCNSLLPHKCKKNAEHVILIFSKNAPTSRVYSNLIHCMLNNNCGCSLSYPLCVGKRVFFSAFSSNSVKTPDYLF